MGVALIVLFGILLPAVTLTIELSNGMCAQTFFDPLPTIGHVLMVALVPLANLLTLAGSLGAWTKGRTALLFLNGVALGISLIYTLAYLPITPLAVMAILALGMGLLPLAPLCSLVCGIVLRTWLLKMPAPSPGRATKALGSIWLGGTLGVLVLLVMEGMISLTLIGAEMAVSDSAAQRNRGVSLLRRFGNRDELLRMCYRGQTRGDFLFGENGSRSMSGYLFPGLPRADAQKLFFRVTGQPYNSAPLPRGVHRQVWDEFDFDPDVGGQMVAGRRKGLSLNSSRMDVQLQPDPAVAYLEWTMVFENKRSQQQEARAQVLLPPGGVVSRVSLWVNGEPREAAFGGAAQVREAYQKVAVVQRRDPLLVTWAGPDRVMLQCFPVPPNGEMKIRLGITAPLLLQEEKGAKDNESGAQPPSAMVGKAKPGETLVPVLAATAALRLPCFAERNFGIAEEQIHSLWVESDRPYQRPPEALQAEQTGQSPHVLSGMLSDEELASVDSTIRVTRSTSVTEAWTPELKDPKKHVVQKIVADQSPARRKIVLVVDGSVGMAAEFDAIDDALQGLPPDTELTVLLAGDDVVDLSDASAEVISGESPGALAKRLRAKAGVGGCDNVAALLKALDSAAKADKVIVWIHAAQPVLLQPVTPLAHRLERGGQVALYDLPTVNGPNRVIEELKSLGSQHAVPRLRSVSDDLHGLLSWLAGQAKQCKFQRSLVESDPPKTPKSSSHIARLWAADQTAALVRTGKAADRAEAVKLAASHQLVTAATGAVVLENQQQYEDAKLHPVDPDSTPVIPEPGTLVLLLAGLPGLMWWVWRRRTAAGRRV